MKKHLFALLLPALLPICIFAQNIGINATGATPHASAMLDISATNKGLLVPRMTTIQRFAIPDPAIGLLVFDTNIKGFFCYKGGYWTELSTGDKAPWLITDNNVSSGVTGNTGIGTAFPATKLEVTTFNNTLGISHTNYDATIKLSTQIGGTSAGIGTFSPTNMRLFSNGISRMLIAEATGYIGIGTDNPTNKFQIGSIGNAGFTGNDLAIGNGTNAMVMVQSNSSTLLASTTDIILQPRYGGTGRVGINTTTPRAPLEVLGTEGVSGNNYSYINLESNAFGVGRCYGCTANVSIYASNAVMASEFDALSDARIKDIAGISDAEEDLKTINALHITNYTMKDKVQYGAKPFKKVIAQDVEKVYPQIISKHTDFIPNVYQLTSKIEKAPDGYLLSFAGDHHITHTAKKLRLILENDGVREFDIASLPSAAEVIIKTDQLKNTPLFVYGEQVDDCRTVDYEGLTTLNISATQEISRQLRSLTRIIAQQQQQIRSLQKKLSSSQFPGNTLTKR